MKLNDLKKIRDNLDNIIKENNKNYYLYDERMRMAKVNRVENKALETLAFSFLPYALLTVLSITGGSIIPTIVGTIPAEVFSFFVIGSTLCVGSIGRKFAEVKYKVKERLKSFTNANTDFEKFDEEVKYAIEIEKIKNRNNVISQTWDILNQNQSLIDSLSVRYNIKDKTIPKTQEESRKIIQNLDNSLNDKYNFLDVLSIQKVLHEKFWRIRTKFQKGMDLIIYSMMSGLISTIYYNMPALGVRNYLTYANNLASVFTPFVVGATFMSGYLLKRNRDYKKIFDAFNSKLGENSLPDNINECVNEIQDIEKNIVNKINELASMEAQLQEQKIILESFKNGSESEISLEVSKEVENTQKMVICIDEEILDNQREEDGPTLGLKKRYK